MAVIAPSDPYQTLSRKIGYSVGLENVWRNAIQLATAYASNARGFKLADWNKLVTEEFGRNESAAEHIANFFSSINLLKVHGKEVHALYGLDALLILRRHFEASDDQFEAAVRLILLQLLIEADADIFLNCLKAEFDREKTRSLICKMVNSKWDAIRANILNVQVQDRLWDIISIRSQTPVQKNSSGKLVKENAFGRRTQPLSQQNIRAPKRTYSVEVLDSYLDKILPTRKGWARDLGMLDSDGLSAQGTKLLKGLFSIGMGEQDGAFRFWPYPYELAQLRLTHEDLHASSIDSWSLLTELFSALGGERTDQFSLDDERSLIELLKNLHGLYRAVSPTQGSIRHQLPIYVAKPVVTAIYLASNRPLPDLPGFIQSEIRGRERRFDLTNIRGTEGALVFR